MSPKLEVKLETLEDGTCLTFQYPKLPWNTDFETFRKTDESFKRIIKYYIESKKLLQLVFGTNRRKERFIFSTWPRDPEGPIMRATPLGKNTGNGCLLWGPTLYDFYHIKRYPKERILITFATGSRLAAWAKHIGELDAAKLQICQAEMADEPYEMQVFDIGGYIEVLEEQVWKGRVGKPLEYEGKDNKKDERGTIYDGSADSGTKSLLDSVTRQCLYSPSIYPSPWPLKPFSVPLMRLQRRLPLESLPLKLIVHDPWKVLELSKHFNYFPSGRLCKWGSKPDVVRIYNLKLETNVSDKKDAFVHQPRKFPPEPDCPLAHLYITPKRQIGKGHHSFVFQVELELPRELLVQPKLCFQCALDKSLGGNEMKVVRNSKTSKTQEQPTVSEAEVPDEATMQQYYSFVCKKGEPFEEKDREDVRFQIMKYMIPQVGPRYCKHLESNVPTSPSQKASVIAKLALPDDEYDEPHCEFLAREARNYQRFPSHMFEHWNGYNIIPPLHEPTPVGAVVPQFYGFYVPDEDNEPIKKGQYMSPILLLEHCGHQVEPKYLTSDESVSNRRRECFSLLQRLHLAGFVHRSVYQRNIVTQRGPLVESPFKRSSLHPRFRLIDFGRSYKCDERNASREMDEEMNGAFKMLDVEVR